MQDLGRDSSPQGISARRLRTMKCFEMPVGKAPGRLILRSNKLKSGPIRSLLGVACQVAQSHLTTESQLD